MKRSKEYNNKYMKNYRDTHPENSEYQKEYHKRYSTPKHKEIATKRANEYYKDNKNIILERLSQTFRYKKYGLTFNDFSQMVKDQNGLCAICGNPCITGILSIDHNHDTGLVRGLLCRKCNIGIGMLNDDVELLEKAIKYLIFYK